MSNESLRKTKETLFAEQVKNKIKSSSPQIRRNGLFDATNHNLKELSGESLVLFREEKDSSIKSRCAWALGRLRYLAAFDDLVRCLRDRDKSVRIWSAWALGEIGLDKANRPLIEAQEIETVPNVRRTIGGALKKLRLEPTRVHRKQVLKQLQPPLSVDSVIMAIVKKLEILKWTEDTDEIIALREQILKRDPVYFKRYMEWFERKPTLENTLTDKHKFFSTDEIE
jgi:HEAT repeat protein